MKLKEKNEQYCIYHYGYEEVKLDGQIKIYTNSSRSPEILIENQDARIGKKGTMAAVGKLQNANKNHQLKETMCYQS